MNPTATENARPGTADWGLARPARAREIEGYASATSVNRGDTILLYVHTDAAHWTLEVFRIGWYAGLGARRVCGPIQQAGVRQPMPAMDPATGLVDCQWVAPFALTTADAADNHNTGNAGGTGNTGYTCTNHPWPSGVYLARLTAGQHGAQSYIVFVVRDDARAADLLVQLPFTTYQAYNTWGGKSLYHWASSQRQRATRVSFNRPYAMNAQNPAAAYGQGAGEFLCNLQPHGDHYPVSNAGWDVNTVRWLEREGHDAAYCTNLDTHDRPQALLRCKAWLSIGHDEYWSSPMRDHVEAARDAGVHLAFLGANSAYWRVRMEGRVMVCTKKARLDPQQVTDKWRSAAVGRPEEQLIGVMYAGDPVDGDILITHPAHWAFAGTGLQAGDTLPGLLGYEVDSLHGGGPPGVQVLAESPWAALDASGHQGLSHMTVYRAASGAIVFATGSIQWAWGLDDFNAPALRPSRASPAAQRITRNVLHHMMNSSTR